MCTPPSIYISLVIALCIHVHTVDMSCPFNPCDILGLCTDMTCTLDDNCKPDCLCDETSTAQSCLEPEPTGAAPPVPCGNTSCVHGYCDDDTTPGGACVCDNGWTSEDCNSTEEIRVSCTAKCPEGETCVYQAGLEVCVADTQDPVTKRQNNVCEESYKKPPREEWDKSCHLPCDYGVCRNVSGQRFCECDPGAHGVLCKNVCCLDCNGHGACYYDNDKPRCNCWQNYTGDQCENIRKIRELGLD